MTVQNTKLSGYNTNRRPSSMPSYLGLPRISSWKKFANLFELDTPNKLKCDCLCTGRSMVEMLGVLAIVGVLSVGAIAGYSKAMLKYKLNKQAEQISWLLNVMYRHKSSFGRNPQWMMLVPYFIKLGEIPENMITSNNFLHDVFNSRIFISTNSCYNKMCNEVGLFYSISSSESFEQCQNLLNIAKSVHEQLHYAGVQKQNAESENIQYSGGYIGSRYCNANRKCIKDITQEQIYDLCRFCTETSQNCLMYIVYQIND